MGEMTGIELCELEAELRAEQEADKYRCCARCWNKIRKNKRYFPYYCKRCEQEVKKEISLAFAEGDL